MPAAVDRRQTTDKRLWYITRMATTGRMAFLAAGILAFIPLFGASPLRGPAYTADGQLKFPEDYREWVFLSSGSGMTYGPLANQGQQSQPLFDNVFVNPESYRSFLQTGHWPDKTVFLLEVRSSEGHASINNGGHFQRDVVGIEAEVKDSASAAGEWAFYGFALDSGKPSPAAKAIPRTASCYSCHGKNTAVENTFVQFYPVLYEIAEQKGTIKPDFAKLPLTGGKLLELVKTRGWETAERALADTVRMAPDAAVLSERSLNRVGYGLLQAKNTAAVPLFEWTAARYAKSPNAQDSLAEAYLAAGNRSASRQATERALELLDGDASLSPDDKGRLAQTAKKRLDQLK